MKAIRLHAFGAPEHLVYEDVADPRPAAGQVRIRAAAVGVHLIDTTLRKGIQMGPLPLPDLPAIPGREVAGTVDAVGEGIDPAWLGRRAVAHLGPASGGYAELAVREAGAVHAVPDGVPDDVAVAMIGTGRTAMAILDVAQIARDDVVLVTAAAGGLGALLVQAALEAGARTIGAAGGPEKVALVLTLGAEGADYTADGWADALEDVTVALDGVGGALGRQALEALAPGGRHVIFGFSSGAPTKIDAGDLLSRGIAATAAIGPRITRRGVRGFEEQALEAAATGRLTPLITRFPLREAAAAHTALETRGTTGNVVLIP